VADEPNNMTDQPLDPPEELSSVQGDMNPGDTDEARADEGAAVVDAEAGAPMAMPPEEPAAEEIVAAPEDDVAAVAEEIEMPEETAEETTEETAGEPTAASECLASEVPQEETVSQEEMVPEEGAKSENMDWYILKVQSNREDSIRDGLIRRVAIAGLDQFFGDVIVPIEEVTEFKGGKRKVMKRKLYPGYIVVNMEINDDTWFLVRETSGIGDFTGAAGSPTPMLPHEVSRILVKQREKSEKAPKLKIAFSSGDQVKINEGTFENFEGEVDAIDETNGRVTVMINIFGRSTPVELEYWQIEAV